MKKKLTYILSILMFIPCMLGLVACESNKGGGKGNGGGSGDGGKQPSNPSSLTEEEIKSYIPNEFSFKSGVKMTISTNSTFNGQTAETILTYYKTGNNEIVSTQNQFDSISDGEVIKNDNDRIFIKIGDKYYEKTRDNLRDKQYTTEETSKGGYQRFIAQEMKYLSDLTKYIDYAENLNVEMSKDILGSDYKTTYSGKQVKVYDEDLRKNVITYDIKMSTIFVLSFPEDNWYPTKIEDAFYAPTELKAYSVDVKVILNEDKTYNHVELLVQRHKDYTPASLEDEKYEKTVIDFEYGKKVNFNNPDLLEGLKSTPSFGEVTFDDAEISDFKSRYSNGEKVTLPTPTKEGATFLGWYYDAGYTMPVENNVITVVGSSSNYTNRVFAKWSNGGRPTLVMNGGKFSANAEENFNEAVSVGNMRSVVLEQYGKAFVGFYKDAEFSEMIDYYSEEPLTSDMTFYAKWVNLERVTINTSHFTYKTIDQMGKPGYKLYAPVVETEAGWIFKNWIDNNGVTYTESTVNNIKFGEITSLTAVFEQGTIVRVHDIETVLGWVETEGDDKDGKELDTYFIYGEDTEKSIKYNTTRYNDWLNENKGQEADDSQFPVNNDLIYTVTVPTGKYITNEWGGGGADIWQQLPKSVRDKYPSIDQIPGWTIPYMGFTVPLYYYGLSTNKPTVDNPWQSSNNVMATGEPIDMWILVWPHEIVNFQIKVQGFDEPIRCLSYFDPDVEPVGGKYGIDDEVFFPSYWYETYNFPAGTTYRDYVLEPDHIKYYDHNWWKDRVIGTAGDFQALKEAIIRERSWYDLEDGIPTLYVKLERYTTVNVHVGDTTTKLYPNFINFMEENDSALIRYLSYGYSEDEGETQYVPLPAKYYFDMPFNGIYYAPVSTLGVPAGKIIEGYYYDAQFTNPCDLFGTMMADRLYAGENIDIYAKFVDADSIQVRVENKSYFYDKSYSFTRKDETTENGTIKKYGTVIQNDNSEYFFTFTSPVGLYDGWRENLTEMNNADYKYLDVLLELGYLRKVDLLQKTAKYDFVTNGKDAMKNYTVENISGTKIGDLYTGANNPDKDESEGGETTTTTGRYYYVYEFTNVDSNGTLVFDYNDLIAIWQKFTEKYDGTLMFDITLNEVFNYVNVTQVRYFTQNTWSLDSDGNIDLNGFSDGECNVIIGNNCYLHYNDKDGNGNSGYIRVILGAYDNDDTRREEQDVFYLDKTFTMCTELDHRNNSNS